MAWTAPRTWVTSETVTAAMLNEQIRDNMTFLNNPPSCRVYHNANQTLATSGYSAAAAFNSERWDTDLMHDTATNNSRITFQTAGKYLVACQWSIAAFAGGARRGGRIRINGGTEIAVELRSGVSINVIGMTGPTLWPFAAGDYIEFEGYQDSGGSQANALQSSSAFSPEFWAIYQAA
jgi:hypothetical protein